MRTATKRILSLLLCAMMILPLVACSNGANGGDVTTVAASTTAVENAETTAPTFEPDTLPDSLDYNKADITIFAWQSYQKEFSLDGETGDIINDALYSRIRTVEDRLNVKINIIDAAGDWSARNDFVNTIAKSVKANDAAYDMVCQYSCAASIGATQGLYLNLLDLKYLDFEKPWWPSDIINSITINKKLYFASGDISTALLHNIFCIYFNQSMITDYNLENPYDLVKNGKWTFSKLKEMTIGIYEDLNGNGKDDEDDKLGFMFHDIVHYDSFYYAAGLKLIENDSDGTPMLSDTFASEKTTDYLTAMCSYVYDNKSVMVSTKFSSGNTLMANSFLGYAGTNLRDTAFDWGVIPLPKYDEAQENYISTVAMPYSQYSIPTDVKDPDRSGALMEAFASEGYRQTSPAIFETAFKIKYARDDTVAQMYDLIRDTLVFDTGRIFADSLNCFAIFRNAVRDNTPTWASTCAVNSKIINAGIKNLLKKFSDA